MSDILAVTYDDAIAVTPSDTTDDPAGPFAGLQCTGTAGLAKIITGAGRTATIFLPQGICTPIAARRVFTTGTAATSIIGLRAQPFS